MSMTIGLAGKPNAGKSTFFKAATLADVEIANYPFTTINANRGVTYVRAECPCMQKDKRCGNCQDGIRFVPIEMIDVAGLVPDAHTGRGLGNAFLDELRQAQAIIHVIDASGGTDIEGNPVDIGDHDPMEDVDFLNREIAMWMTGILKRNWDKLSRKIKAEGLKMSEVISEQLMGAGVNESQAHEALLSCPMPEECTQWSDEDMARLCEAIRAISKPTMIAANKIDVAPEENVSNLENLDLIVVPTSAAAELALRSAAKSEIIKYLPGDDDFDIISEDVNDAQRKGLESLKGLMQQLGTGGGGIQECINRAVFDLLDLIVVYPVEDEGKWSDKNDRMLPDAFLMKKGSTAHDLAYRVHTDIGDRFLYAVDGKTKMRLGEKHELNDGDVIKIVSTAK
ncbi:redox-regulated ATPase YchF [Methanococcoides methylutens]|uniref:GTP-binding and nucleic acid-binding protein YchF n=1 Tax=Methanococcoides methylutens MM1 TaxID=1434104 RepID=A0A0E3WYY7_METMT|nr:redox-regulated ATPase YchF [Methanococcoides methylutens]AKB84235.1 GTP-binding and nucleic acid-binding protein YchF [Methanococcoides methylutens MM1]